MVRNRIGEAACYRIFCEVQQGFEAVTERIWKNPLCDDVEIVKRSAQKARATAYPSIVRGVHAHFGVSKNEIDIINDHFCQIEYAKLHSGSR